MGFSSKFFFTIMFVMNAFFEVGTGECKLSLNKPTDFGTPQPIFLHDGEFLAPNVEEGAILLEQSDTIVVSCSGNRGFIVLGNDTTTMNSAEAICIANKTFRVGEWVGTFKEIRCNKSPALSAEMTPIPCYKDSQFIRVGYWVRDAFKQLYEVCFNVQLLTTPFVQHTIGPASFHAQSGRRPNFKDLGHFGKLRIDKSYQVQKQKAKLNDILGPDMDKKYLTKNQRLTRGHLAPRADFPLRGGQVATFIYANVAPQWQRGNTGDWAAVEQSVRARVRTLGIRVQLYTGTYGVCTLRDAGGTPREVYLATDVNNNPVVPVPMYFYKVIYEPVARSAVAFITINSSYYNQTEIEDLTFCEDVCRDDPGYSWIKWRDDGTTSFCCNFKDFNNTVDQLKHLQVEEQFV